MFSRSLLIKLVIGCLLGSLLAPALFVRAGQPALSIKTYLPTIINTQITSPNLQTLLASYVLAPVPRYSEAKYIPRGFSAVPYVGWDQLSLPGKAINDGVNTTFDNADWLTLQLNRPAQLSIVWRGQLAPPTWMSSWTLAEKVIIDGNTYPTFRKTFPAGKVVLGAVNNPGVKTSQATYLVLFAEQDGRPSTAPTVPAGKEVPKVNATCPAWVHDQYATKAPDGRMYPTWHPQIDPVYWCYFQHDHGSDPHLFKADFQPAYGYTMPEAHVGFKGYVFEEGNYAWYITMHFGSGTLAGTCARFHTTDLALKDKTTGKLVADLHLMGDYGKSIVNTTSVPLQPPSCPDQANVGTSTGVRLFASETDGAVNYTPWRLDDTGNILGLKLSSLTIWTDRMMVRCNNAVCDIPIPTGGDGLYRFVQTYPGSGVQAGSHTGVFYTDGKGKTLLQPGDAGAIKQYVEPGLNVVSLGSEAIAGGTGKYRPADPWQMRYVCTTNTNAPENNLNLEGAVQGNN
jgi:hypothetical protein